MTHPNAGEANPNTKLTETQVRAIRADTRILREIAADHGVSMIQISRIKNRTRWKHL